MSDDPKTELQTRRKDKLELTKFLTQSREPLQGGRDRSTVDQSSSTWGRNDNTFIVWFDFS